MVSPGSTNPFLFAASLSSLKMACSITITGGAGMVGGVMADPSDQKALIAQLVHGVSDLQTAVARSEVRPFVIPTRVVVQILGRVDEQSFHGGRQWVLAVVMSAVILDQQRDGARNDR